MGDRASRLLRDIQKDALDDSSSVSGLLRKCIALGGASGSRQLVEWASAELSGYDGKGELPAYRTVRAPLMIDGITGWTQFQRKHIAPSALPKSAGEYLKEEAPFVQGVGTLEAFVAQAGDDAVLMAPPGASEMVRYWNDKVDSDTQEIHRIYWSVSKSEVAGILHEIRNRLIKFVAELEIDYASGEPTTEAVNRAVNITMGDGGTVAVAASGRDATTRLDLNKPVVPAEKQKWKLGRKIWAAAVGSAGIAGAIFAYLALPR